MNNIENQFQKFEISNNFIETTWITIEKLTVDIFQLFIVSPLSLIIFLNPYAGIIKHNIEWNKAYKI